MNINKTIIIITGAAVLTALLFLPQILTGSKKNIIEQGFLSQVYKNTDNLKEAMWYEKLEDGKIKCNLCPNECILKPGQRGICKVRENIDGKLYALNYAQAVSINVDPIEKKPIFHMLPGSTAFSIATAGCNLSCLNCQNWQISQSYPEDLDSFYLTPQQVVDKAIESGSKSIAYTYSEPIIFYEYMLETAKLAHDKDLKNIMVTAGYINPEPLAELLPYIDAFNVDLKGFSDEFYMRIVGGHLDPVLDSIKIVAESDKFLEITYLIIPGENDSFEMISAMLDWVLENVGENAIVHFSRFHPLYKLTNKPETPLETLINARDLALKKGLKYVYIGNVVYPQAENTYCNDGSIAIERQGYFIKQNKLEKGKCADDTEIPGVWE